MSTEPDYNFNEAATSGDVATGGPSIHLPFALLTATLAVVMITQTTNTFKARSSLREGKAQLLEAKSTREPSVKQSGEIQKKLQELVLDLLLLAKTDDEAKAIVQKYNIQQTVPPGAPEAAPAPTP